MTFFRGDDESSPRYESGDDESSPLYESGVTK